MRFSGLTLWVADNTLSEKFYKKLGADIAQPDDNSSVVDLGGVELTLVSMRDEDEFLDDSLNPAKGKGMYIYLQVDDVDQTYSELVKRGLT